MHIHITLRTVVLTAHDPGMDVLESPFKTIIFSNDFNLVLVQLFVLFLRTLLTTFEMFDKLHECKSPQFPVL